MNKNSFLEIQCHYNNIKHQKYFTETVQKQPNRTGPKFNIKLQHHNMTEFVL